MKKTFRQLCIVALLAICTLPALAQLNGTGFYRFRNVARPTEYISITNDRFNYYTIIDDAGGGTDIISNNAAQQRAVTCSIRFLQNDIHMVEDPDIIDLASVIYAKKKNTNDNNYEYNLIGQGTSLLTLTTGTYSVTLLFFPVKLTFHNLYVTLDSVGGSGANTLFMVMRVTLEIDISWTRAANSILTLRVSPHKPKPDGLLSQSLISTCNPRWNLMANITQH